MLFKEMSRRIVVPDVVTYSTLVEGFCKLGKIHDAQKLFSKMQACGQFPDVQTYSVLLDGLCKSQQLSKAMKLLRELVG